MPAALTTFLAIVGNLLIVRIISEYGDTVIAAFGVMPKIGSML
jgi:Na+-driven multidrug efflux pump